MLDDVIRQLVAAEVRRQLAELRPATPELVSPAAYARARSISPSTVRQAIREGRLQATRIGRSVRVPADATIAPRSGRQSMADRARRILGVVR